MNFKIVCQNFRGQLRSNIPYDMNQLFQYLLLTDHHIIYNQLPQMIKLVLDNDATLLIFNNLKFRLMAKGNLVDQSCVQSILPKNCQVKDFVFQSCTIVGQLPIESINMNKLPHPYFSYTPELFPAARLVYMPNGKDRYNECINVFASGKYVITGVKSPPARLLYHLHNVAANF